MRLSESVRIFQARVFGAALLALVVFVWPIGSSAHAAAGSSDSPVVGTWTTLTQSQVTIAPCATGYCGVITKVVIPQYIRDKYENDIEAMQGNIVDGLNKNPALRQRQLLGLQILSLEPEFSDGRMNGRIYNPEDGETYEGFLEVIDHNNLRLSGCILFNLICLGEDWVRTSEGGVAAK